MVCALHRRPEHGAPRAKPRTDWTRCVPHFVRSGHAASVLNSERASSLCALWPSPPRHRPPPDPSPLSAPGNLTALCEAPGCAARPAFAVLPPTPLPTVAPTRVPTVHSLPPSLQAPDEPRATRCAAHRAPGQQRRTGRGCRAEGCARGAVFGDAECAVPVACKQHRLDPPPPRTKWTRRVPHPVLIGHAASLTPY